MELSLAFSPCPNDTFIFEALVHNRIDTEGLSFRVQHGDIRELNQLAEAGTPDVVKVSFFAYHFIQQQYALLESGAALGRGCGPLLVARRPISKEELPEMRIGIPGWHTTAHLLLHTYAPTATKREVMLFHEIMPAVADGRLDAGLIIHESRFTYPDYGLQQIVDLGAYWEETTGKPIPLGGIVAKQSLGAHVHEKLSRVIRRSVEYAYANREVVMPYIQAHAQEMDEAVMNAHIALYVNEFSLDLGKEGHSAIDELMKYAADLALPV
jgi:1,4-dihydroxy-6-naphthoate synthase